MNGSKKAPLCRFMIEEGLGNEWKKEHMRILDFLNSRVGTRANKGPLEQTPLWKDLLGRTKRVARPITSLNDIRLSEYVSARAN